MGSFTSTSSILVSHILKKTNQTTNSKPFTQSCVHSVSLRLFSPCYCQISQKIKKSFVFTVLQRPPFCLKLKGHWWHPSGQTQWSSPQQFPSLSHIIKLFSQQPFISSYPFCPLQAHALCSFSACKSLICTWDGLSSRSCLWKRSELHFQAWWQLGFRKTSQGGSAVEDRWSEKPENLQAVGLPSFLFCSNLHY